MLSARCGVQSYIDQIDLDMISYRIYLGLDIKGSK